MAPAETFQIEPPPRESSGTGRLLLGIGIGCGIMGLLCCGVFVGLGWWFRDFVRNAVSTEPATIQAETARIAQLDIPDRFEPQMAVRIDPPFVDELGSMVMYADEAEQELLVLGDFQGEQLANQRPSEVFREVEPTVNVPLEGQQRRIDVDQPERDPEFEETSREEFERPMRGGTARFELIQGVNTETGQERIIVYGIFPGRRGTGIFMLNAEAEETSVEGVKQVIESLE